MAPNRTARLVVYVSPAVAAEVRRQAALDGRTVSTWLSRLVSAAVSGAAGPLGNSFLPAAPDTPPDPPAPPAGEADADDPEYREWLRHNPGRR